MMRGPSLLVEGFEIVGFDLSFLRHDASPPVVWISVAVGLVMTCRAQDALGESIGGAGFCCSSCC